jgi:hypothetical protein
MTYKDVSCPLPLYFLFPGCYEVGSSSPTNSNHHDILSYLWSQRTEADNHGLTSLNLWSKISPFLFKLLFLGICHSDKNLTNPENWCQRSVITMTAWPCGLKPLELVDGINLEKVGVVD